MDWFPDGRKKLIHSIGAVCRFTFVADAASPYTGVFAAGAKTPGLIRMGSALPVTPTSGVVPGVGVKFLRTSVGSGNFVALNTLDPLPGNSYNFFERNLTNHIPAPDTPATQVLVKKFQQASQCATQVGLSDICAFGPNGEKVVQPVFPFKLFMRSPVQLPAAPSTQADLQAKLAGIAANTRLFDLWAYDTPAAAAAGTARPLGTITTQAACVNSRFGDEQLFFKHQRGMISSRSCALAILLILSAQVSEVFSRAVSYSSYLAMLCVNFPSLCLADSILRSATQSRTTGACVPSGCRS